MKNIKDEDASSDSKKFTFALKRSEAIGWVFILLGICACMFMLGIFVGRGTVPVKFDIEKIQRELIALREAVIKKEQERFKVKVNTAEPKPELGFYEALKNPDTNAKSNENQKNKPPVPEPIKPVVEPDNKTSEIEKKGNYTIQVAAVQEIQVADKTVLRLRQLGYSAYRTNEIISKNGKWYRVRIGDFADKQQAELTLNRLTKDRIYGFILKH